MKTSQKTVKVWKRLYLYMAIFAFGLAMAASTPSGIPTLAFTYANLVNLVGQLLAVAALIAVIITVIQMSQHSTEYKTIKEISE
jgi:hypothetical protein